jgi:hypothetical protein
MMLRVKAPAKLHHQCCLGYYSGMGSKEYQGEMISRNLTLYQTVSCQIDIFSTLFGRCFHNSPYLVYPSSTSCHQDTRKSVPPHHHIQFTCNDSKPLYSAPTTHPRQNSISAAPEQTGSIPVLGVIISVFMSTWLHAGYHQRLLSSRLFIFHCDSISVSFPPDRPYSISMVPGGLLVTAMC